jgi:hypothetical protein
VNRTIEELLLMAQAVAAWVCHEDAEKARRAKRSAMLKASWQDPEYRARMMGPVERRSPEERARMSAALKRPEARAKLIRRWPRPNA